MAIDVIMTGDEAKEKGSCKDARTCTWTAFMNGRWTKDRPVRPGRYRIASNEGLLVGEVVAVRDRVDRDKILLSQEWDGWFWSFPTPPPPQPVPRPETEAKTPHRPVPPPPKLSWPAGSPPSTITTSAPVVGSDVPEDKSNLVVVNFRRNAK